MPLHKHLGQSLYFLWGPLFLWQRSWHCYGICWQPAVLLGKQHFASASWFASLAQPQRNPVEKSWISGLYQNKCIQGSQINIVWGIIVLCFLNFKCLTLHLFNIHRIFLLLHFVVTGSSWLVIKYYEQSWRNPQIIGKYINLFQISLYLSSLVLEANNFKADLQIVSAC